MKRTRFGNRILWISLIVLALMSGGGYAAYAYWLAPQQTTQQESTLQTATVTIGNLSLTADGTGVLLPSITSSLSFSTDGTVEELSVEVGDKVQAGDVLAAIDDTDARKAVADAELGVVQAKAALEEARDTASLEQAVAQAGFQVAQAKVNLQTAESDLDELLNWAADETEFEIAKAGLVVAQATYHNTVAKADMSDEQLASTRINLEDAVRSLQEAQASYANAMDAARDWEKNIESTRQNAAKALQQAQDNLEVAQASYDLAQIDTSTIDIQSAWVKVLNAKTALEDLQTPPDEQGIAAARIAVQEQELALQQARLDLADAEKTLAEVDTTEAELALQQARLNLEAAQQALDGTTLVAPISGTVLEVNAVVGEAVSGTAIVLADLDTPLIEFWVEESDLDSVVVGNPVHIVFEALPALITVVSSKFTNALFGSDRLNTVTVSAASKDQMDSLMSQLNELVMQLLGTDSTSPGFTLTTQDSIITARASTTETFRNLLSWVAGVSLVVGEIGIMNIMLVSVTDRTREIGLRQALGARPRDVQLQFLLEAMMLSLLGGLAGVLAGVGGSYLFSALGTMRTALVWASIPLAFGAAAAVGIFFGYYPATKAAQLDPIVALRRD